MEPRPEVGMQDVTTWRRWGVAGVVAVIAAVASACTDAGDEPDPDDDAPAEELAVDVGVTDEPCPDAVNPDNGCIYLGVLSDLTEGPFHQLAVPITEGQRAFWRRVNQGGGIGGFDVDIDTYTRDNRYDPEEHRARFEEVEPEVLALAQTFGTPPTEEVLDDMDDADVVAAPASWWSGWSFDERDRGLVLESGYSYCLEAMLALDWHTAERARPASVMAVGYPGDYGEDVAAGAEAWADHNGVEFLGFVETDQNAVVGTQDAAVGELVAAGPDVVLLATGPMEAAEIVEGAAAQDFQGQFLGSAPTWNPMLLETPAAQALQATYVHVAPWEGLDGTSAAHDAIRESLGDDLPANDGYVFGWVWSYPIKALLEAAVDAGDLTRSALRAGIDGLEVDYEGALPPRTLGGDPDAGVVRQAVVSEPDPDATLGLTTVATGVTGPTADAHEYTQPCAG